VTKQLVLLVVLAGCHSQAQVARAPTRTPYLALFERGKSWTLPVGSGGSITCQVADVKQVGDANVARLTCAAPHAGLLINGGWVATPAGLYHPVVPVDEPDELALLGEDDLLLAAHADEREHAHAIAGTHSEIAAFTYKASWCVRETTTLGDNQRSYTLCFDANGITGGDEFTLGGDATAMSFGDAPEREQDTAGN
jgi:hypothetical protein